MPASYPKPDGQRVNRVEPKFGWVDLPREGRSGEAPVLPAWMRVWQPATGEWWANLWSKPQAVMWEQDGSSLWDLACLKDDLFAGRAEAAKVENGIRQHQDRHGLNPKAMLQLRWRLAPEEPAEEKPKPGSVTPIGQRRQRLRVT